MLPFCGVFIPTYLVPGKAGHMLSFFPLVTAVEYFRHGYYGARMPAIYQMGPTLIMLSFLTLFALAITKIAIRRVQLN
jgi:capsular polysaccharide transport system permease protein